MNQDFSDAVLELYREVTGNRNDDYSIVRSKFIMRKVYEPLVHTSRVYGKVPVNRHLLEDDLDEEAFDY